MCTQGVLPIIQKICFICCLAFSVILSSNTRSYAQGCPIRPTAAFKFASDTSICLLRNVVRFTDTSIPNGSPINRWFWDFGDGETDNTPNPVHTYRSYGKFKVKLTVSSNASCPATSPEQAVSTLPTLRPAFDIEADICPNVPVKLTDRSEADRTVKTWTVNYGDGTVEAYTSNLNWTHVYKKTGKYTISLTLTSADAQACVSDVVSKEVEVTGVSFNICQSEVTQFTDETDPNDVRGFTYAWNFGDPSSTISNANTSTLKNPTHKYSIPGTYTATLIVRAPGGCIDASTTRTFTIGEPIANFAVANAASLCGTDSVAFVDKTDTTINIKRLVWFYDVVNHPADSVNIIRQSMPKGRIYRHYYGVNSTGAPITYKAKLIARIGGACPDPTLTLDVVINPTPVVTPLINGSSFAGPYALCSGAGAVTLSASANLPGVAVFTGTGIVNGHVFDPSVSGTGNFEITCVYTADATPCVSTTTFNIVVGSPIVSLPAATSVLEGRPTQVNLTVTGNGANLTFSWSPSTGVSDPTARNPFFSPTQDTRYTLEVTSAGGCKVNATIMVNVLKTPIIPNAFTPNSDGVNDTWNIQYLNTYPGATIEVFNRNGTRVYYANGYSKPWDGTTNGSTLPVGVYYYVINPRNGRAAMSGSLTIMK